ncbi:MAG: hypothetical protein WC454_06610 [Phycisphaerae bacterium]
MKRAIVLLGVVSLLVLASAANANWVVAVWGFGSDSSNYTLAPQYDFPGTSTLTAGNADYDTNGGDGVTGQALHWNDVSKSGDNDAYIIITTDTSLWYDMSIRWDYKSDNTGDKKGPVSFDLDYQVDDSGWINILDNYAIARDDTWHEFSYDLSWLGAINIQPSVQFRINDFDENDLSGDYWQDNVELTGTLIPEPLSVVFLALGGVAVLRKRPKQK